MNNPEPAPVFEFDDQYRAEDYWPEDYVAHAAPVLEGLGWLVRPLTEQDTATATTVLRGLFATGLDETDVYPFGLLWALRSTGVVGALPGLDAQLRDWRTWEESDHFGEPLGFLPDLPSEAIRG